MEFKVGDKVKYKDTFLSMLDDITERKAKQQWNGVIVPRAPGALSGFIHVEWVDHNGTTIDLYHYPSDLELMPYIIKPLEKFGQAQLQQFVGYVSTLAPEEYKWAKENLTKKFGTSLKDLPVYLGVFPGDTPKLLYDPLYKRVILNNKYAEYVQDGILVNDSLKKALVHEMTHSVYNIWDANKILPMEDSYEKGRSKYFEEYLKEPYATRPDEMAAYMEMINNYKDSILKSWGKVSEGQLDNNEKEKLKSIVISWLVEEFGKLDNPEVESIAAAWYDESEHYLVAKRLPAYLQPGPPAGSGYSKEYYECTDCGYINYDGYKKETNKESLGKGYICPQCGGMELTPLEDTPPMSARDRYAQREVHISKHNWSFDMENGEIKLSLGNLSDAGWFWAGDASDLNGYLVRMSTSQVKNEFITETERAGLTLQELKPYIVDSITNGSGVYEITGDNQTWRFGTSDPDLDEELEDVEGLTKEDKEGIKEKFWGYFSINFDDFNTDYGQIFREEFTARLGSSNTIGDYLTALQEMRLLGAEQYQEYEMFAVSDALIKAKEEWETGKQIHIKPLEQFG